MTLFFKTLASSSKGNAAVIYTGQSSFLVDAGISFSRIAKALQSMNLDIHNLTGVFITHAHSDHVRALPMLLAKTTVPVYCTKRTHLALSRRRDFAASRDVLNRMQFFEPRMDFGDIVVETYPFPHGGWLLSGQDHAGEHIGFKFNFHGEGKHCSLGFATDLGHFPEDLIKTYFNCDFYLLESNHDVDLQLNSDRPAGLIKRNLSNIGHLSNDQAAQALLKLIHPDHTQRRTREVVLAHLSRDCNSHDLARDLVTTRLIERNIHSVNVTVAPFDEPSPTYCIQAQ